MSEIPSKPGATDVAALSGAIVAVAVSLFVTPGEYSLHQSYFQRNSTGRCGRLCFASRANNFAIDFSRDGTGVGFTAGCWLCI